MVPLIGPLVGQRFSLKALVSAAIALFGLALMSWESGTIRAGDFWMIGCALSYAAYVLMLDAIAHRHAPLKLTAVQMFTVTALSLIWLLQEATSNTLVQSYDFNTVTIVLYLGILATAGTTWAQAVAQKHVSAYDTALMYTLEPVFALLFSFWLLNETLGVRGLLGSSFILVAMVFSQLNFTKPLS
jgi:drug/metabolite transporter (DMT)-like permease